MLDDKDVQMVKVAIEVCGYPKVKAAWNRIFKELGGSGQNSAAPKCNVCESEMYKMTIFQCSDCMNTAPCPAENTTNKGSNS